MADHSRMETARDFEEDGPGGRSARTLWTLRALGLIVAGVVVIQLFSASTGH